MKVLNIPFQSLFLFVYFSNFFFTRNFWVIIGKNISLNFVLNGQRLENITVERWLVFKFNKIGARTVPNRVNLFQFFWTTSVMIQSFYSYIWFINFQWIFMNLKYLKWSRKQEIMLRDPCIRQEKILDISLIILAVSLYAWTIVRERPFK